MIDALSWKNTYTVCKYLQDYDPSTLVVRYEDLTLMPQQTIKDICLFLDIPYDDTLLSVAFSNASDVQMKRRGIYLNSGNYKKVLAPTEIAAAQTITKGLLKRYNYQLEKTPTFVAIASLKEWASLGIQLVRRLWKRFRLFNRGYFWAFLVLNFNKLRRGMLKSGLR